MMKFIIMICVVLITMKVVCGENVFYEFDAITIEAEKDTMLVESKKMVDHFLQVTKSIHINVDKKKMKYRIISIKNKTINGLKRIRDMINVQTIETDSMKTVSIVINPSITK